MRTAMELQYLVTYMAFMCDWDVLTQKGRSGPHNLSISETKKHRRALYPLYRSSRSSPTCFLIPSLTKPLADCHMPHAQVVYAASGRASVRLPCPPPPARTDLRQQTLRFFRSAQRRERKVIRSQLTIFLWEVVAMAGRSVLKPHLQLFPTNTFTSTYAHEHTQHDSTA